MMNFTKFKPMKPPSGTLDINDVTFPKHCSIKYDGFRVVVLGGRTWLNSLREVDNDHTRELLMEHSALLEGFDGELTVGNITDINCFNNCQSAFSKASGKPDFTFWVFDRVVEGTYKDRFQSSTILSGSFPPFVKFVEQTLVKNREELDTYVEKVISEKHEGVMLRDNNSLYKFGRGTFKLQQILRIKPMETSEAIVTGFEQEYENTNEKTIDNHGNAKRSGHKAGKVAKDTLGKLICNHQVFGEIKLSGFTDDYALAIWKNQSFYLGRIATFSYQAHGTVDKPRIAKFKGFRSLSDMS